MWKTIAIWLVAALVGAGAGFGSSLAHPGARGPRGAAGVAGALGVPGPTGAQGPAGPAGKPPPGEGVCVTGSYSSGVTYVVSVYSPAQHSDGTDFCESGVYT